MCNPKFVLAEGVVKVDNKRNVPFETALDLTGFGKYNYFMIFVCSTTMLASITDLFGLSYIVQAAACDLELDLEQRGILTSVPMIGIVLSAYFWGYLTDTKGRRSTLLLAMSVACVATVLSSFSPNMATLTFFKFISVTFSSAAFASTYTLLGECQPKKYRDKILILLTCANLIALSAIVAITYPLLTYLNFEYAMPLLGIVYKPWRLLVVCLGLPTLLSVICLTIACESSKFLMSRGKKKQALDVLRKIFAWNNASDGANYSVESLLFIEENNTLANRSILRLMWSQCIPLFKKPYRKYTFLLYYIVFWIGFVNNSIGMWVPYIFNKFIFNLDREELQNEHFCTIFTYNPSVANITNGSGEIIPETCVDTINIPTYVTICVYSAVGSVFAGIFAVMVNSVGKRILIIAVLLICSFCGFIIYWITIPMLALVLLNLLIYAFLAVGLVAPYIVEIYPTYIRGMAGCLSIMMVRTGGFLGIYMVGITFEPYCEVTLFVFAFLLFTCAVAACFLPSEEYMPETTE